ncbi:hypothetical protein M569_12509, partial [Genlisea aurea]
LLFIIPSLFLSSKNRDKKISSSSKIPKSYPVLGSFYDIFKNKDRFVQWTAEIVKTTPSNTFTLRRPLGHEILITADPDNVRHILKTNFHVYEKGDLFKDLLGDLLGNGIFNADGEVWKFQRQIASHEFNTKSLRKFVDTAVSAELSGRLLPLLKNAAADNTVLDFQDILQRFAFDSICKIAFGYDPECLAPSLPESAFAVAFDNAVRFSSERFNTFHPGVWKVKRALNLGESERELKSAVTQIQNLAKEIIRQKKKKKNHLDNNDVDEEDSDLLSRFLSSGHSDEQFVMDIVISFILAGRDTTSAALTWFFWLLSSHPHVETAILQEINNAKQPESGGAYDEVKEMLYIHASISEAMRLYPPVPFDSKCATADDVLPDGSIVRKDMVVAYHPYAMGRDDKIWGSDWSEFRPERWLENKSADKLTFVNRDAYTFPVFQAGPRICLGKEMAFMQMKSVIAGVVRDFKIVPVAEEGYEPEYLAFLTAKMKGGFPVRIQTR